MLDLNLSRSRYSLNQIADRIMECIKTQPHSPGAEGVFHGGLIVYGGKLLLRDVESPLWKRWSGAVPYLVVGIYTAYSPKSVILEELDARLDVLGYQPSNFYSVVIQQTLKKHKTGVL